MSTHHQDLLNAVLDVIQQHFAHDIAIMIVYGSFVDGTLTPSSDLDMLFIPKTPHGEQLACTFILNGTGNDLWGADWARLGAYAAFDDMKVSVLAESRLVYYDTEADRERYEALLRQVDATVAGPLSIALVEKAEARMRTSQQYYGALSLSGDITAAGGILYQACDIVCLLNHTYLPHGMKRWETEMGALLSLPDGFMNAFAAVASACTQEERRTTCRDLLVCLDRFTAEKRR